LGVPIFAVAAEVEAPPATRVVLALNPPLIESVSIGSIRDLTDHRAIRIALVMATRRARRCREEKNGSRRGGKK
jgi:hypothetical protein